MRRLTVLAAVVFCIGLGSAVAYAGCGGEFCKESGLSDQQITELKKACRDFRRVKAEVGAKIQLTRIDLEELTDVEEPDIGKIEKRIDKIAGLEAQIKKAKARKKIALRKIMGPEKFEKFQACKKHCVCRPGKASEPHGDRHPDAPKAPGCQHGGQKGHGPH